MINPFFITKENISLFKIFDFLKIDNHNQKDIMIENIKPLDMSSDQDITFIHSPKYKDLLDNSKYKVIITNKKCLNLFSNKKKTIVVKDVLSDVYKLVGLFYPDSKNENPDLTLKNITENTNHKNVQHGQNFLIGNNVKIGKNCIFGNNVIIESNVIIGDNCIIGSNIILKKTIIGNNVYIQDGAVIGKPGFGFFPKQNKNFRYPHVGMVLIRDNVEIGCNNTIDRGSLSNTVIGENTFIDNQVHIAHNVQIGKNCIIAGQVSEIMCKLVDRQVFQVI